MKECTNIQEFIDYVEEGITKSKKRSHNHFGVFDIKFSPEVIAMNSKIYFLGKGYNVEMTECKSCKSFDFIFSW